MELSGRMVAGRFLVIGGAPLAPAHRFYLHMGAVPTAEIEVHQWASTTIYVQTLNSPDDLYD